MVRGIFLFALAIFPLTFTFTNGQCLPQQVQNVTLHPNSTLTWEVSPLETCTISHFRVNFYSSGPAEYEKEQQETSLDVSFLPYCETWIFTVRSVVDLLVSPAHTLITRVPMPPSADLTLKNLEVVEVDGDHILTWQLDDEVKSCADSYRVTVDDEEIDEVTDYYVRENAMGLSIISPCVEYEFGVRAIYRGTLTEEGPLKSIEFEIPPKRQTSPQIMSVKVDVRTADIVWSIDSRQKNRCPLGSFFVDGGNNFNFSFPLADPFERIPIPIHLTNLQPNRMYLIRAAVENNAGLSYPSIVGIQTLDVEPTV